MKRLLIVVDMQNDFIFGSLGTSEARAILSNVDEKVKEYRSRGDEIVFTRDTHGADYFSTQEGRKLPVQHCIKDTDGWQIVDEPVFDKGVFGSVALAEFVASGNYDEVALVGVCTDICVLSNAVLIKSMSPELPMKVFKNCCAGVSVASHEAALVVLSSIQIEIL